MKRSNADAPAVVIGGELSGLGVIRSLGEMGVPVIALDSRPEFGLFSKYCIGEICPNVVHAEASFIDFLLRLGERFANSAVLFPTTDAALLTVSKHRDRLEKYYKFPMAKIHVIEKLVNKKEFHKWVQKAKIPHPKTFFPQDIQEARFIANKIVYPCIVKPVYSHRFYPIFRVKGFKADCREKLIDGYQKAVTKDLDVVIQEAIPGNATHMYCFGGYFDRKSEPVAFFSYKRVREWPIGFGNGCLIESIWEPEIIELGTKLLQTIGYHGIMDAEFKKDPRDNEFKILEVNARSWWQNKLATRCGVNIPYLAYRDALGEAVKPTTLNEKGVKWLYMLHDLKSARKSILKGDLAPREWLNSLRGEKEYAVFAKNDPGPFVAYLLNLAKSTLRARARAH